MTAGCTNEKPCCSPVLRWVHSPVCRKLTEQGAKTVVRRAPDLAPATLSPPKLDVAKGDGRIGCGCGKAELQSRDHELVDAQGLRHRYGKPCDRAPMVARSEPPPRPGAGDVNADLIAELQARSDRGLAKYGTRLQYHNGRRALRDAREEALDLAVYLQQADGERMAIEEALFTLADHARGDKTNPQKLTAALELADSLRSAQEVRRGG